MTAGSEATRVLVVEDHLLVATGVVTALRDAGMVATSCSIEHPQDVLDIAASTAADIVLLDLVFEGSPARALTLAGPLAALGCRVVAFTGVTDPVVLGAAIEAGAVGVIHKSGAIEELVEHVRCLAAGAGPTTPSERDRYLRHLRTARTARAAELAPFATLTGREAAVLGGLLEGRSADAIAVADVVSVTTVRAQIRAILTKLGVNSQLAAVAMANRAGWQPAAADRPQPAVP